MQKNYTNLIMLAYASLDEATYHDAGKGSHSRLYSFTYQKLTQFVNISVGAFKQWVVSDLNT